MNVFRIGFVGDRSINKDGLWAALQSDPNVEPVSLEPGDEVPQRLAGIVIDVAPSDRFATITAIAEQTNAPVLTLMPTGQAPDQCQALIDRVGEDRIASLNSLMYDVSIGRMVEQLTDGSDSMQTMFASWRLQPGQPWSQELAQIVDLAGSLTASEPVRVSAVHHASRSFLLAMLRYGDGAVLSLEVGNLLPEEINRESEVIIECFGLESAYQCTPDRQALTLEGATTTLFNWSPNPAVPMLSDVLAWLETGGPPKRGVVDDLNTLKVCESMLETAAS